MAQKLAAGQPFPKTHVSVSDGSAISLPDGMGDGWKMVLFFRGSW